MQEKSKKTSQKPKTSLRTSTKKAGYFLEDLDKLRGVCPLDSAYEKIPNPNFQAEMSNAEQIKTRQEELGKLIHEIKCDRYYPRMPVDWRYTASQDECRQLFYDKYRQQLKALINDSDIKDLVKEDLERESKKKCEAKLEEFYEIEDMINRQLRSHCGIRVCSEIKSTLNDLAMNVLNHQHHEKWDHDIRIEIQLRRNGWTVCAYSSIDDTPFLSLEQSELMCRDYDQFLEKCKAGKYDDGHRLGNFGLNDIHEQCDQISIDLNRKRVYGIKKYR